MAHPRHKHAAANTRRRPSLVKVAAPIAVVATLGTVGLGMAVADPEIQQAAEAGSADISVPDVQPRERDDEQTYSRSDSREAAKLIRSSAKFASRAEKTATLAAVRGADEKLWTEEVLNLWDGSLPSAKNVGEMDEGKKVLATGRAANGREEIVVDGESRWVTAGYLTEEKPVEEMGVGGECTNGTSVPSGVSPNIVKVHEAVCAAFPEITTYGTFRGDGEHAQGLAVDIMVSGARGQEVADFVRAHYQELGVSYVIYSQQIWSVQRSGEGWRGMEDRGSTTANHYDHVHVTTY